MTDIVIPVTRLLFITMLMIVFMPSVAVTDPATQSGYDTSDCVRANSDCRFGETDADIISLCDNLYRKCLYSRGAPGERNTPLERRLERSRSFTDAILDKQKQRGKEILEQFRGNLERMRD